MPRVDDPEQPQPLAQALLRQLRRRTLLAVAAKLVLLVVLYLLFFSPAHRLKVDASSVEQHFLSPR